LDTVKTDNRGCPRKDCNGIIMFNVLSDDLNFNYGINGACIKGIAQAVNMNENGMMMRLIDILGLSNNLQGFSFKKFRGKVIEFCNPDNGKTIRTKIMHVSDNKIGVRYL
jgi:hypothetical protein